MSRDLPIGVMGHIRAVQSSKRKAEAVTLAAAGKTPEEIADDLGVTPRTVRGYLRPPPPAPDHQAAELRRQDMAKAAADAKSEAAAKRDYVLLRCGMGHYAEDIAADMELSSLGLLRYAISVHVNKNLLCWRGPRPLTNGERRRARYKERNKTRRR